METTIEQTEAKEQGAQTEIPAVTVVEPVVEPTIEPVVESAVEPAVEPVVVEPTISPEEEKEAQKEILLSEKDMQLRREMLLGHVYNIILLEKEIAAIRAS
jgi:hypothetical protein